MNDEQIAPFTACLMGLPDLRIISIVAETFKPTEKNNVTLTFYSADNSSRSKITYLIGSKHSFRDSGTVYNCGWLTKERIFERRNVEIFFTNFFNVFNRSELFISLLHCIKYRVKSN